MMETRWVYRPGYGWVERRVSYDAVERYLDSVPARPIEGARA